MAGKFSISAVLKAIDHVTRPVARITGSLNRALYGVGRATAAVNRALDSTSRAIDKVVTKASKIGSNFKTSGIAIAAGAAVATAGMVDVIKTGSDFEDTLVRAGVKFGTHIRRGTPEFEELRKAAEDAGAATEFSGQQAAAALKSFAGAGFKPAQAIAALPGTIDFATVAEIESLEEATDAAVKTLGAFNLKVEDSVQLEKNLARATDVLAKASDSTSATVAGLYESILEGGPIATTAGQSIETFTAIAAQLADSGIERSVAGTTLKNFFLGLAAPTKEAAAVLSRFSIKTKDAQGNMLDSITILGQLERATAKLGTAERAEALEDLFGKIPIAGIASLVGSGSFEKLVALRKELEGAAGSTALQAGIIRTDSPKQTIDELTSAWEGLKIAVFSVIGADAGAAMKSITASINEAKVSIRAFFNEALPFVRTFVGAFGEGFREAMPAVRAVLGMLFTGFGDRATWMNSVREFASLLGQITAFAFALGAVLGGMVAAGLQLVTAAVNVLIGAWDGLIATVGEAVLLISEWWDEVKQRFSAAEGNKVLYEFGRAIVTGLVGGINALVNLPFVAIDNIANGIKSRLKGLLGISSPSKVFRGYGEDTVAGFTEGLKPMSTALEDAMPRLPGDFASDVIGRAFERENALARLVAPDQRQSGQQPAQPLTGPTESVERTEAEVTIRAPKGMAEVTKKPKGGSVGVRLQRTGAF